MNVGLFQRFSLVLVVGEVERSSGELLAEALAREGDSVTVKQLIERAAKFRDMIDRCDELIWGKREAWTRVRTGSDQVVEVRINDVVKESKALTTEFRQLLAEINRQRASAPVRTEDDDVLDDD